MKKNAFIKLIIFSVLYLNIYSITYSQIDTENKGHYQWFDRIVGEGNNSLYNGNTHLEQYRTEDGNHKFFLMNEYVQADILYDNQAYYGVDMKYDLYEDHVIARLPNQSSYLFVRLIPDKIHSFLINGRRFINYRFLTDTDTQSSSKFYELLFKSSNITLLKKEYKVRSEYINDKQLYSKFSSRNYYAIVYDNSYKIVKSRKDFTRLFPSYKKQISAFFRTNRKLYKSSKDIFYKNLVEDINANLNKTDTKI